MTDPELGRNPDWRRDIARLQQHGLNLELMMYPYQAGIVREIAEALPDLQIIINHCGSPIDRDEEGMRRWRDGLKLVSACPNVAIKISNPGAYDHNWTLESVRDVAMHCIDCFGVERCMFESNFPVDKVSYSGGVMWNAFKRIAAGFSDAERRALFHDTAVRTYGIESRIE